MYVRTYVCMIVCLFLCLCVCMYAWLSACLPACLSVWRRACTHVACMSVLLPHMHGCMFAYICSICSICSICMYRCMDVCVYACMTVCMYACMIMYVCMDVTQITICLVRFQKITASVAWIHLCQVINGPRTYPTLPSTLSSLRPPEPGKLNGKQGGRRISSQRKRTSIWSVLVNRGG